MKTIYTDGNYSIEVSTELTMTPSLYGIMTLNKYGTAVLVIGDHREEMSLSPPLPIPEEYQRQIIKQGKNPEDFFFVHDKNGGHIIRRGAITAWEESINEYDTKRKSDPIEDEQRLLLLDSLLYNLRLEFEDAVTDTSNPEVKQLLVDVMSTIEKWEKIINLLLKR